jgi:large subunit ribosomal protein L28
VSQVCAVCGKRPRVGLRRSHANNASKRLWRPNVQRVRAIAAGTVRRINACTRCIRSGFVQKA